MSVYQVSVYELSMYQVSVYQVSVYQVSVYQLSVTFACAAVVYNRGNRIYNYNQILHTQGVRAALSRQESMSR